MDEQQLYGIGYWDGNTPEENNDNQRTALPTQSLFDLHLPDCPTKSRLLDQCAHCSPAYYYTAGQVDQQSWQDDDPYEDEQIQPQYSRSYTGAFNASSARPIPVNRSVSDNASRYIVNTRSYPQSLPQASRHIPRSVPTPPSALSWAAVSIHPDQMMTRQYRNGSVRASSFVHNEHSDSSEMFGTSQAAPMQRNVYPPLRMTQGPVQSRLPQQSASYPPPTLEPWQLDDQDFAPSGPTPDAIDVFVQQTAFGGHRRQSAQTLSVPTSALHGYAPPSPSTTSSRGSRTSTRRKGNEMRDLSYPFECQHCHHRFLRSEDLRRHMARSHTAVSERPYKCVYPDCVWAFVNPKDLNRHLVTHAGNRPRLTCPFQPCPKTYTRNDNLQRHINREHGADSAYVSMSRTTSSHTTLSQPLYD